MNTGEIDLLLRRYYQRFWDRSLVETICGSSAKAIALTQEIDGPFLLKVHPQYELATPKVVVVGQENNGWIGPYSRFLDDMSIDEALRLYEGFDFEKTYNSTFFQYFARIRQTLFGSGARVSRSVMWLNLFKFNQGMNPQMIYSAYREDVLALQSDVFQQEIDALRPDVVIFLTGPYYDSIIERFYPGVRFQQLGVNPVNQVAQVVHHRLPNLAFRTYHPSYLNRFRGKTGYCLPLILGEIFKRYSPACQITNEEQKETLFHGNGIRIERIVSHGHVSPPEFWHDQEKSEFVLLVQGAARLRFEDEVVEMKSGDWIDIPAHRRHRVEWTTMDEITVWLAVFHD